MIFPILSSLRFARRPPFSVFCLLGFSTFFCGCASYQAKPLQPESSAENIATRSLQDPGLTQFAEANHVAWPPAQWDLTALTFAAWYYHPDMRLARSEIAVASAEIRTAAERPEPSINFVPQRNAHYGGGLSPWTLGFMLDVPIETAGKRGKRTAVAQARADSIRYRLASTAWQVHSGLRSALLGLWSADAAMRLARLRYDDQAALTASLEQRFTAGEINVATILPARIALDQDRLVAQESERLLRITRADLGRALGVPSAALDRVPIDYGSLGQAPAFLLPTDADLRRLALQSHPAILSALADYATAEATLRLEIAKQYPDVHLGPGYMWDQGVDKWSVGIGFTLPILNRNRGAIAQAEANRATAATRFESLQAKLLADLETAQANFAASLQNLRSSDELQRKLQAQLDAATARFNSGDTGRTDLLAAKVQYDDAAAAHLAALVQTQTALGALQDVIERPLDPNAHTFHPLFFTVNFPTSLLSSAAISTHHPLLRTLTRTSLFASLAALGLSGCAKPGADPDDVRPAVNRVAVEAGIKVIKLTPEDAKNLGLETATLAATERAPSVMAYGVVQDLRPWLDAASTLADAHAQAARTESALSASSSAYERARKLHDAEQNVSVKELQAAEAAWRADEAANRAAQSHREALEAALRNEWGPVLLEWMAGHSESYKKLTQGQEVLIRIAIPGASQTPAPKTIEIERPQAGRIAAQFVSLSAQASPEFQTQGAYFTAPAGGGLVPGLNVPVAWPDLSGEPQKGTLIPSSAVLRWQGKQWLYVQVSPAVFTRLEIAGGQPEGGGVFASNWTSEKPVVVQGAQALLSEEFKPAAGG